MAKKTVSKPTEEEVILGEAPETVVEEAPKETPKKVVEDHGTLGVNKLKILSKESKVVNGVEYVQVKLADGATYLLLPADFEKQHRA